MPFRDFGTASEVQKRLDKKSSEAESCRETLDFR